MKRLHARSIFEIIKISVDQKIRMNAKFVHEICIENEYDVYVHTETKKLVNRITIIDVEVVHFIVKYISVMNSETDAFQIKIKYRVIFTRLVKFRIYVKIFFEINDF